MSSQEQHVQPPSRTPRFDNAGVAQPFPGNTVLIRVLEGSEVYHRLQSFVLALSSKLPKSCVAWLPSSSWHITITSGVCDVLRDANRWPPGMSSLPLEQCTREFSKLLMSDEINFGRERLGAPYHMRMKGIIRFGAAIGVALEGATDEEELRLRALKDRIADILGFRHPNHGDYSWHISLAYLLSDWSEQEAEDIVSIFQKDLTSSQETYDFGAPEFCTFEDMVTYQTCCNIGVGCDSQN